ncbi:phage tail protein I [Ursidibacter arcticus]|uniref:phage tail protein I n=1 Tax=Ursidibacter arcticus TaxID=1524965 RepID=UPI0012FA80A2|nr:phage tail protein I [Ursidibacter arcticus]KAE9536079.1 phage tail protein [Ursidibacter arcticus]
MITNPIAPHTPLLPTGSSPLEKRATECLQQAVRNPILIADLINPERCPEPLLPYLAWAFSVDKWDEHWSEGAKRIAIKNAFLIHKQKGTITALRRVVEPIGYIVELKEWWQESPPATAGTFKLTVEVSETGLNQQTNEELIRLIEDVKPVSRHFTLAIAITPVGEMNVFMASQMGEIITVYP